MRSNRPNGTLILSWSLLALLGSGPGMPLLAKPVPQILAVARTGEYAEFLSEKFGIVFQPTVSQDEFLGAIRKAAGLSIEPAKDQPFEAMSALESALRAADLKELAATYPPEKVDRNLAKAKAPAKGFTPTNRQALAAALDTGLLSPAQAASLRPGSPLSRELANTLLGGVLSTRGLYKHYLGYLHDPDILARFTEAYKRSALIQAPELRNMVDAALKQKLVTGYNLKDVRYDPQFIQARALTYGHSDLDHAIQLLGLLKSEGLDAKVQFEPKTSAFVYLKEWGDPGQPTEDMEVKQIENGDYIEYAREYDVSFEFNSVQEKTKFQPIIMAYAKKNQKDQKGLLVHSWWQPLYLSRTELPDYRTIANHYFLKGHYYAQTFATSDKTAGIVKAFQTLSPGLDVKTYTFWVDEPFYRYLQGESK